GVRLRPAPRAGRGPPGGAMSTTGRAPAVSRHRAGGRCGRLSARLAARHRRAVGAGGDGAGEAGRILVLGIGFAVVLLALILVVASVSAIHLDRKRALALADAAAAAVADSVSEDGFYGDGDRLLTDEMVRAE